MEGETYLCEKWGNTLLKSNKLLHDLRCTPRNNNSINIIINNPNQFDFDQDIISEGELRRMKIRQELANFMYRFEHPDPDSISDYGSDFHSNIHNNDNENEDEKDEENEYENEDENGEENEDENDEENEEEEDENDDYGRNRRINNNIGINNINNNRNRAHRNYRYLSGHRNHRNNHMNNHRNNIRNNNNVLRNYINLNLNRGNNNANRTLNNNINYSINEEIEDEDDFVFDSEEWNQGVNNNIINTFPTSKITNVDKLMEEKRKCCICLEDYKNDDEVLTLPCIHLFHSDCIKTWTKRQNNCPICKYELK